MRSRCRNTFRSGMLTRGFFLGLISQGFRSAFTPRSHEGVDSVAGQALHRREHCEDGGAQAVEVREVRLDS